MRKILLFFLSFSNISQDDRIHFLEDSYFNSTQRIFSNMLCRMLISLFLFHLSSASLLLIDRKNPCRAYGNASVFDITNLVRQWPVTLKGSGYDGREYNYWWSCAGRTGFCTDPDTAVCQQRTDETEIQFNAGNVSPQLWFGQFNGARGQVRQKPFRSSSY